MSAVSSSPIQFKFKWLDDNGNETGFFSKSGSYDGTLLRLDDVELPAAAITNIAVRENRMAVTTLTEDGSPAALALSLSKISPSELKSAIDIARSEDWAELHKKELQKKGGSHSYRDELCPKCGATILLSDMAPTPQLYCHFCDTLTTVEPPQSGVPGEQELRVCEECGMFSKPRKFTVFYFYFLLVVYGWRYYSTWRCPACMRGLAWKMFFGNFLFVLGVPVAVYQLFRSYGGTDGSGPFKALDASNLKARKGDVLGSLEGYRSILDQVPHSAGIKYNLGLALLQQEDLQRASESFRVALDDCSNYVPAYSMLCYCYDKRGKTEELKELQAIWDDDSSQEEAAEIHEFPGESDAPADQSSDGMWLDE